MELSSVLAKARPEDVRHDPYPHLVVDDCLPAPYYEALAAAYPSTETIMEYCRVNARRRFVFDDGAPRPNHRYDIPSFQALERPDHLPAIWRDFIHYHTSARFYAEVLALFGDSLRRLYPSLERKLGKPLSACTTGVRFASSADISLDCQVGINTPPTTPSSVRRVHVDAGVELFAMLLYFRDPGDEADGGDLEIYRWRHPRRRRFRGSEVEEADAVRVETIGYKANRMVVFVNSHDSLHAVTTRAVTPYPRRLVNIIGEVDQSIPKGLFRRPKRITVEYVRKKLAKQGRRLVRP